MKRTLFSVLALISTLALNSMTIDRDLWKEYEKAQEADQIKSQISILDQIIEKASKKRQNWDFYRAWQQKVSDSGRLNWKEQPKVRALREQAFLQYDEPVILLVSGNLSLSQTDSLRTRLLRQKNSEFYSECLLYVRPYLKNDYEFALWYLFGISDQKDKAAILDKIDKYGKGTYPTAALCDYFRCNADADSLSVCQSRWKDKAVSLLAEQELVSLCFDSLSRDRHSGESEYQQLRRRIAEFEKKRKSFKGEEGELAKLCTLPFGIAEILDSKDLNLKTSKDSCTLFFRNLDKAQVYICNNGNETLLNKAVNPKKSYYVWDSVSFALPKLNDGEYVLIARQADIETRCDIDRYHISLAVSQDSKDWRILATDAESGKPLTQCRIFIKEGDKTIAQKDNFLFKDEFTRLPEDITSFFDEGKRKLSICCEHNCADGTVWLSRDLSLYPRTKAAVQEDCVYAHVLKDCGAYHREDILHYKVICYTLRQEGRMSVVQKGMPISVRISSGQDVLCTQQHLTDEYGCIDGEFHIPGNVKGGSLLIMVMSGQKVLTRTTARVDDFVLPDFDCTFQPLEGFAFAGDTVCVKGCVKTYSGHSFLASGAYYTIGNSDEKHGVDLEADGSFSMAVTIPDDYYRSLPLHLVIRSSTGETQQFDHRLGIDQNPRLRINLDNALDASVADNVKVIDTPCANFAVKVTNAGNVPQKVKVTYEVYGDGKCLKKGEVTTPCGLAIDLPESESKEYSVKFTCGKVSETVKLAYIPKDATCLDAGVQHFFLAEETEGIALKLGASCGPLWLVACIYGNEYELLYNEMIYLGGERGKDGSLVRVVLPYQAKWPDSVKVKLFYFKDFEQYEWSHTFKRPVTSTPMAFEWSRTQDSALPSNEYEFNFTTEPGAVSTVSVFDASTERIASNKWFPITAPGVIYSSPSLYRQCGTLRQSMSTKGVMYRMVANSSDAIPFQLVREDPIQVRSDFSTMLYWNPTLVAGKDGKACFKFRTSDKTGSFLVNVFTFDKKVRTRADRAEFKVALPVQLSVAQPQFLREGDMFDFNVTLSALSEEAKGKLKLYINGEESGLQDVEVHAKSAVSASFPVEATTGSDTLSLMVKFVSEDARFSDAIAIKIPVLPSYQTLTEAHSSVLLDGADSLKLLDSLRSSFVNTAADGAVCHSILVKDMIDELMASREVKPGNSSLNLSDAICTSLLRSAAGFDEEDFSDKAKALAALQGKDGGFAWFEGMKSSAVITATLLERNARVEKKLLDSEQLRSAISFLDQCQLSGKSVNSLSKYLYVRSFYPEIKFEAKAGKKEFKEFSSSVKKYLFPGKVRGLNGQVFEKVMRLSTLHNLSESVDLVKAWGVGNVSQSKLSASVAADVESLSQYAVRYCSGGSYFPNLVMPLRGMTDSEAYCHSILAELMDNYKSKLSNEIRLWLLLQKETQKWDSDYDFITAASCILHGSKELLDTRVLALSKSYTIPYTDIRQAGNGISVSRSFVKNGNKVTATYKIWSEDNRSFVRLNIPYYGALRPVKQLSGMSWNGASAYREVRYDRSEYYFENLPEGETQIREEFYLGQDGSFTCPAIEAECLFAPHYRANSGYEGKFLTK